MSATDNGPTSHGDDMSRALHDLVDDASLPGLDTHLEMLRGRTRRRRAAKKVALGASTLAVAGVLGLAATTIPQDVRPRPVAPAESPSESPVQTVEALDGAFTPVCGDDLTDLLATTTPLTLTPNGSAQAPFDLTNTSTTPLTLDTPDDVAIYLLDAQGTVISTSIANEPPTNQATTDETPTPLDLDPGKTTTLWPTHIGPCTDQDLPTAGTYTAIGILTTNITTTNQEPQLRTIIGGPWIITTNNTGELTTIAGRTTTAKPTPSSPPPVEPVLPSTPPAPIEVRDVLADDTSVVLEALLAAAATGAPVNVDLTFETEVYRLVQFVDDGGGQRTLTVPKNPDVAPRERAASDDGWAARIHGGAYFLPPFDGQSLGRLLGTYKVTVDSSGPTPVFTLREMEGGTPAAAPETKDRAMCQAFQSGEVLTGTYNAFAADLEALANDRLPSTSSPVYQEIRSRWIDAPRMWWALLSHEVLARETGLWGDFVNGACYEYWN